MAVTSTVLPLTSRMLSGAIAIPRVLAALARHPHKVRVATVKLDMLLLGVGRRYRWLSRETSRDLHDLLLDTVGA